MSPDEVVKLNLRLSKDLHRRLIRATKTNNTSLQQEIIDRLARSFDDRPSEQMMAIIKETAREAALEATASTAYGKGKSTFSVKASDETE